MGALSIDGFKLFHIFVVDGKYEFLNNCIVHFGIACLKTYRLWSAMHDLSLSINYQVYR